MVKIGKDFIGQYSLSKTLRFELIPMGKTLENIKKSGLLQEDQHRAESYVEVKKIIDRYHKAYIEKTLAKFTLPLKSHKHQNSLTEYLELYNVQTKDDTQKKAFKDIQGHLRQQIADCLTGTEEYKRLDKKELIREDLLQFVKTREDYDLVKEFENFTTYFTGFYDNRKNMYSAEEKATAISYRLINENLPKFIDNMHAFQKITTTSIKTSFKQMEKDYADLLEGHKIEEVFELEYFNHTLTQGQIDAYNTIIGGKTLNETTKVKGLNEYINLYNQKEHDKLPKLKRLFKQILSEHDTVSFLPEVFTNDNEVLESIEKYYEELEEKVLSPKNKHSLENLLKDLKEYDLNKIYVRNDLQLTDISQKMFGSWNIFSQALKAEYTSRIPRGKKEKEEKYEEKREKYIKNLDSISLQQLLDSTKLLDKEYHKSVLDYFAALKNTPDNEKDRQNIPKTIKKAYEDIKELLNNAYPDAENLAQNAKQVEQIKALLDAMKDLQRFIKPLLGRGDEAEKDARFYGEFLPLWEVVDNITSLYNKVRNYMTKKPYSTDKIKLNFANSTLLGGWDVNKEHDNTSIILRKKGLYYLAIMNKENKDVFDQDKMDNSKPGYEKMNYKLLPGPNKMLPKVFFSKSRIDYFQPSKEIYDNYQNGTHKKGTNFNLQDCHKLIDFFKASINKHEDWKNFGFKFSPTAQYEDISGFYREVEQQGYKITFCNVAEKYVEKLVEEGKVYLFQIYNKDFSTYSKGTPNMHTFYWKMLFDQRNLTNAVYKLNGEAEVFYRRASIKTKNIIKHTANKALKNKNVANEHSESIFKYDLIKDKRYTVDKFQFHVPITMNFKNNGNQDITGTVREYIKANNITHVIGLDRGERHLLYLSLIDLKGNIVKQYSLNNILNEYNGHTYATDYNTLLTTKEIDRDAARKNWQTIENIKELKEGYVSQVVHKIAELIVEYNAIVVLEDLNFGFKRGRQKVERQVYQKFETMLINKLNYLVDKHKQPNEDGGLLKAFQLTNKFESFQKLGKQSGILFYVPAWNTSKIDPTTGFVNLLDTRYSSIEKAQQFFSKFLSISYNAKKKYFEFSFDYSDFTYKAEGTKTKWTICTLGTRIETFRNVEKNSQWDSREIDLTQVLQKLFAQYDIAINEDLQKNIVKQNDKKFFEQLLHLLHLTLQMRNSITGTDTDYMTSPVANAKGKFYDSRNNNPTLPENADANGAYNIARKGLWVIEQIKQADDLKKVKLAISNKEWLVFAQKFDK